LPWRFSKAASFATAVQEQLGLKLDRKKAPLDFLVIDRVERVPSALGQSAGGKIAQQLSGSSSWSAIGSLSST
jgi:hypothetical protein